jgi:outer membrane lipoprotein-sorting protein
MNNIINSCHMRYPIFIISIAFLSVSMHGQQLQEILQQHYQASAQEKIGKIETIITHGKNIYSMAGIGSSFILYQARPMKIRIESTFQGSSVVQAYNGELGWMYAPSMGISEPKEMSNNELKTILNQAEFESPLWNYEEQGNSLEVIDAAEDEPEDHVKLTRSNGDVLHFFIDRESHLINSIRTTRLMGGTATEISTVLQEYKSTRGIPVARKILTRMNGETVTTTEIEKVEFNKKIDPALFEKPVENPVELPSSDE